MLLYLAGVFGVLFAGCLVVSYFMVTFFLDEKTPTTKRIGLVVAGAVALAVVAFVLIWTLGHGSSGFI